MRKIKGLRSAFGKYFYRANIDGSIGFLSQVKHNFTIRLTVKEKYIYLRGMNEGQTLLIDYRHKNVMLKIDYLVSFRYIVMAFFSYTNRCW